MNNTSKKLLKAIVLAALAALLIPLLTGCLGDDFYDQLEDILSYDYDISDYLGDHGYSDYYDDYGGGFEKPAEKTPVPAASFDDCYSYYYDQLNQTEKKLYDGLVRSVGDGTGYAGFSGLDPAVDTVMNALSRASTAFLYDRCDLFTVDDVYYSYEGGTLYLALENQEYWKYMNSLDKYQKTFEDKVERVVDEIERNCSNDYEKALYAHDYLVKNAFYDHEAADEVLSYPTSYNPVHDLIFTAYGALVNGQCVCAGYAKAYKVLLDRLGIPCVYVVGWGDVVRSDVGHAWNRIIIDGKSYYVDITWDDCLEEKGSRGRSEYSGTVLHNYFNVTTDQLEKTHKIDEDSFDQPDCCAEDYNYFRYNGYQIDSYSFGKFVDIAEYQKSETCVNVRFTNPSDAKKAESDFKGGGWSRISWLKSVDFVYWFDDSTGCAFIAYQ